MNHAPSLQRFRRDANNLPVADSDVAYAIQTGLWIHDSTALDYKIVLLCRQDGRREREKTKTTN
jgi:hypothetical protein